MKTGKTPLLTPFWCPGKPMGTIYLLRCQNLLKVGFTDQSFAAYLRWIRARIPFYVEPVATRAGTVAEEQELHKEVELWRHDYGGREWYQDCPSIWPYLNRFFYPPEPEGVVAEAIGRAPELRAGKP